jgi:hypothetical protein
MSEITSTDFLDQMLEKMRAEFVAKKDVDSAVEELTGLIGQRATTAAVNGIAERVSKVEEQQQKLAEQQQRMAEQLGTVGGLAGATAIRLAELEDAANNRTTLQIRFPNKGLNYKGDLLQETAEESSRERGVRVAASTSAVEEFMQEALGFRAAGGGSLIKVHLAQRMGAPAAGLTRNLRVELALPSMMRMVMQQCAAAAVRAKLEAAGITVGDYLQWPYHKVAEHIRTQPEWQAAKEAAAKQNVKAGLRGYVPFVGNQVWEGAPAAVEAARAAVLEAEAVCMV